MNHKLTQAHRGTPCELYFRPPFVIFIVQTACNSQIFSYLCTEISHKYVFIMARPIRETPVLKGEDAFNFEMRRLEVEHMSKEQRAENRRKFEAQVAEAKKYITVCI